MKTKISLLAMTLTMALTGCGGGGGGGSSDSGTTPPVSQTCSNGGTDFPTCTPPLQTSVPTPTYGAQSQELVAFNEINSYRKSVGLGLLAQNSSLDKSTQSHASYIVTNQIFGHIEDSSKPSYTGAYPGDRALFAGYGGNGVSEVIGVKSGIVAIRSMINTIYHRDGILQQSPADVGISFNANGIQPLVVNFGQTASKYQKHAANFVSTYPVDGQIDVPLVMYPETPNPFADLSLVNADYPTKTSSPITFYAAQGSVLEVQSFAVTDGTNTLPVRLVTAGSDINKNVSKDTAHIVGYKPFSPNTKYTVQFVGTVNGAAVSKTWSFTTGTSLNLGGGAKP